jgi:hypothetical protein
MLFFEGLIPGTGGADYIGRRPSVSRRELTLLGWAGGRVGNGSLYAPFGFDRNFRQEFHPSKRYIDSALRERNLAAAQF